VCLACPGKLQDPADRIIAGDDHGLMMGSSIFSISLGLGNFAGLSTSTATTANASNAIAHAGRSGDEVEAEFPRSSRSLHDLSVKEAEKSASTSSPLRPACAIALLALAV